MKKTKGILSYARVFSHFNKRFFTLDLNKLLFFYTNKADY